MCQQNEEQVYMCISMYASINNNNQKKKTRAIEYSKKSSYHTTYCNNSKGVWSHKRAWCLHKPPGLDPIDDVILGSGKRLVIVCDTSVTAAPIQVLVKPQSKETAIIMEDKQLIK